MQEESKRLGPLSMQSAKALYESFGWTISKNSQIEDIYSDHSEPKEF